MVSDMNDGSPFVHHLADLGEGKQTPSSLSKSREAKSKRRMKTEGSKMDLGFGWRPWKRQLPWHGYLNAWSRNGRG